MDLTTLCTAGIIDSAPGFDSSAFQDMQVMLLAMSLGFGFIAFFRVMEVLPLDLVLLSSSRITYSTSESIFTFMDCQFFLILLCGSIHSFHSSTVPGMQVVPVIVLDLWLTEVLLHLDLGLLSSHRHTAFTTLSSIFMLMDHNFLRIIIITTVLLFIC